MHPAIHWIENILLTAWVGGMWITGFIVTPLLFRSLDDRMLAGHVAGRLFTFMSHMGLLCAGALLLMLWWQQGPAALRSWRLWILVMMAALIVIGEYGISPMMRDIKEAAGSVLLQGSDEYRHFARLHGLSSALFLANSLLGAVLVARGVLNRI